jgi:hypothetical protein
MRRRLPKRRRVADEITRAVLDFSGPSATLKLLWFQLWSYRDKFDQVAGKTQAFWAELFGCTDRSLRDQLADAASWHMLTIHAGVRGNASLYVLHPPHLWSTEKQARRACLPPGKRSAAPAMAPAAAAEADSAVSGDAPGDSYETVPVTPPRKSTI